jgi:hypothetical protein
MTLRVRTQYTHKGRFPQTFTTYWHNEIPITDVHEALWLLQKEWSGQQPYIAMAEYNYTHKKTLAPELHQPWYSEGDSGGDSSGIYHLEISPEVVATLTKEEWVTPMKIPHWGGSTTDLNKRVLSHAGRTEFEWFIEAQQKVAQALPKPLVHSKFSGLFNPRGYGYTSRWGGGKLYFDFVTPQEERVRVYPLEKDPEKQVEKLTETA